MLLEVSRDFNLQCLFYKDLNFFEVVNLSVLTAMYQWSNFLILLVQPKSVSDQNCLHKPFLDKRFFI